MLDAAQPGLDEGRQARPRILQHRGIDRCMTPAQDILDHARPDTVVVAASLAQRNRQFSLREHHPVAARILLVLREQAGKAADRRSAQPDQHRRFVLGEALEVAMQPSACRSLRQRIARQGEMVEANRDIAIVEHLVMTERRHAKTRYCPRQRARIDLPLARDHVRDMGIAEQRHALGPIARRQFERFGQIGFTLSGQAVHQVEIERGHARIAQHLHRAVDHAQRLHPTDRLLQFRGEGLYAERGIAGADRADHLAPPIGQRPRIELDRNERIVEAEMLCQRIEQAQEIVGCQRIGAAAAKGDAANPRPLRHTCGDEGDFPVQRIEIARQPLAAVGGGGIAAAIPADFLAEGDMDVERDIARHSGQRSLVIVRADIAGELGGGRKAGVTRNGRCEQIGIIGPHTMLNASQLPANHCPRSNLPLLAAPSHRLRRQSGCARRSPAGPQTGPSAVPRRRPRVRPAPAAGQSARGRQGPSSRSPCES